MQYVNCLDIEALRTLLDTRVIGVGDRLRYWPEVTSTNTLAMRLARDQPEEGVVVLADSQLAGRGRHGRSWVDKPGCSVLSSTLLRPLFSPHLLVMIASLAVVEAIERVCGVQATIKWPNDVLIQDQKVCGILIETSHDPNGRLIAVLGIGVNANGRVQGYVEQKGKKVELSTIATTLEMVCGYPVSREALLSHLLLAIENDYLALQQEAVQPPVVAISSTGLASRRVHTRWQNALSTLGRTILVHQGDSLVEGVAEAVDENGELVLRLRSGELVCITWGIVEHGSTFPD